MKQTNTGLLWWWSWGDTKRNTIQHLPARKSLCNHISSVLHDTYKDIWELEPGMEEGEVTCLGLRVGHCQRGLAWEQALRQGLGRLRGVHQVDFLSVVRKKIPGRVNCIRSGPVLERWGTLESLMEWPTVPFTQSWVLSSGRVLSLLKTRQFWANWNGRSLCDCKQFCVMVGATKWTEDSWRWV